MNTTTKETKGQALARIASTGQSSEQDDKVITGILQRVGFPNVVVVCGIVYLEGRGTIDAPPTPISTIAGMLLKILKEN